MTLSQEEPEQIGSFKNSRWEIPACSGRKLRVNGRAKVPAERSGLIPRLERSFSDMPRFSLATASLWVTGSSPCRLAAVICNNLILHLHLNTSYVQLLYTSGRWFWPFDPPAWGAWSLWYRCKPNSLPLVVISSSSGRLKMQIETSAHAARLLVLGRDMSASSESSSSPEREEKSASRPCLSHMKEREDSLFRRSPNHLSAVRLSTLSHESAQKWSPFNLSRCDLCALDCESLQKVKMVAGWRCEPSPPSQTESVPGSGTNCTSCYRDKSSHTHALKSRVNNSQFFTIWTMHPFIICIIVNYYTQWMALSLTLPNGRHWQLGSHSTPGNEQLMIASSLLTAAR